MKIEQNVTGNGNKQDAFYVKDAETSNYKELENNLRKVQIALIVACVASLVSIVCNVIMLLEG